MSDCGPDSLRALAALHGIELTPEEARHLARPERDGVSLASLARAARAIGLDAQALKDAPLEGLPFPAIVHVDGDHWVCASGPTPELQRRFTGYAVCVLP